jgi:hypothetical protein
VASHLCQELVPECLNVSQARVLERTPSLSELNEIMYGQAHQNRDDQSFVFVLKVGLFPQVVCKSDTCG